MDYLLRLRFLFNKYLQLSCTAEELEELIALLQQADADEMLTEPMQELWERLRVNKVGYEVDWDKMYNTVLGSEEIFSSPGRGGSGNIWRMWWRIAAVVVVLIAGTGGYWYFVHHPGTDVKKLTVAAENNKPVQAENKRQTIHLPDGSTVILNARSKLSYPSAFTSRTREVYLTGEGYFDIKHNSRQPFLVHAGKIVTKVLGTAFDIKAYPADESVEITVTRGKVQVLKENKNLGLVIANQQISFSNKTEQYAQKTVDTKPIVAWKPQEISFNDITMLEAAKKIEQRFNTVVEFGNPAVKNCRVTATFSEDDMLDEILTVICGVSKSNYIIQTNKILINGKGCNE